MPHEGLGCHRGWSVTLLPGEMQQESNDDVSQITEIDASAPTIVRPHSNGEIGTLPSGSDENSLQIPKQTTAAITELNKRRLSRVKGEGAECSICFAPLPTEPVCVLIRHAYGKKRSCRHYFHAGCVRLFIRNTPAPHLCPLCRGVFERTEALPDVRLNSRAWFKTVDADEGGALEKSEVVDALSATLPVDPELLARSLDGELWDQWDTEHTGRITLDAFEHPGKGLLHFVLYSLPSLRLADGGHNVSAPVPDLVESREGWFRYWDENCRHMLEFLQFLRALVRTLRLDGAKEDAGVLRSVLATVWQEFGLTESNQEIHKPVSLALFCEKPDGFCDALVDALQKEFGVAKFRRIRQRAHLLQQPAAVLKRELRKLNSSKHDVLEKDELVAAILDAQEEPKANEADPGTGSSPATANASAPLRTGSVDERNCPEGIKNLALKEIQHRLRAYGVPYGHCLERADLEDLLIAQGDTGTGPLPATPPPQNANGAAQNGWSRQAQASSTSQGSSAPQAQTMGASTGTRSTPRTGPPRNQPIPTVIEPPDTDEQTPLRRCMSGACALQ